MGILTAAAFVACSEYHQFKGKRPGQLVFGGDMILTITHLDSCRYIRQRKQAKIYKEKIHKNSTRIDHDYRAGYQVTIKRN